TVLMRAAEYGDVACLKALLKAGADLRAKDERGRTVLMYAATGKNLAVIPFLVKKVAVNAGDKSGMTALMAAAEDGSGGHIRALVKAGADLKVRSPGGRTAVYYAISSSRSRYPLRALIRAGADVNAKDGSGKTPLMHAAEFGQVANLKDLLQAGARVDAQN